MNPNPQELLARRQRDYAKALDRHARAIEKQRAVEERVQALERELADAEDEDRRALGDALVDGTKPPARKAERARTALEKAKAEAVALQYAAERAGQTLDRMPVERKHDWLRRAQRDFEAARGDYEQRLSLLAEARERLAEEAAVVSFLIDGHTSSVRMAHTVRVHARGVEGLAHDVSVTDVLEALRDELADLELDALRGPRLEATAGAGNVSRLQSCAVTATSVTTAEATQPRPTTLCRRRRAGLTRWTTS
jgi:hypothetical protein